MQTAVEGLGGVEACALCVVCILPKLEEGELWSDMSEWGAAFTSSKHQAVAALFANPRAIGTARKTARAALLAPTSASAFG
jgi:hypothetical protein